MKLISRSFLSLAIFLASGLFCSSTICAQPVGADAASGAKTTGGKITADQAVRIVSEKLGYKPTKGARLEYDHDDERGGRKYRVVHGYEMVVDGADGTGHTATWGWYYVDAATGAPFEWDLAADKLIPIARR